MDKRKLNVFSLGQVDENVMNEKSGGIVITNGSAIVQAIDVESNPYISRGQTYIFHESRMGIVTSGTAELEVNLTSHHLSLGDIITMPAESIVTIKDYSNDYKLSVLLFPENTPVFDVIHISAENDAQGDITDLYNRLWSICTHTPDRKTVIIHLQQAIIATLKAIQQEVLSSSQANTHSNRQEEILYRFKQLVSRHAAHERSVNFYASQLFVSPGYLMTIISKMSGKSVRAWVDQASILYAKALLAQTNMQIGEVAEKLNFPTQTAFTRYFKHHTGTTPFNYRQSLLLK